MSIATEDHFLQDNAGPSDSHLPSPPSFLSSLSSSTHSFLQPSQGLHAASLALAKSYLDPLAVVVNQSQLQRQQIARRKRKRAEADHTGSLAPLRVKQIYLEGFSIDQIWEQTRRILDASREDLDHSVALNNEPLEWPRTDPSAKRNGHSHDNKEPFLPNWKEGNEDKKSEDEVEYHSGDEENTEDFEFENERNEVINDHGPASEEQEDSEMDLAYESPESEQEMSDVFVQDKLGLNDGFFSIDDFNRQSEFLEQQDARGENNGPASDEEDVDWDTDPLSKGAPLMIGNVQDDEEASSANEESGPTFGNADLNGIEPSDADEDSDVGVDMEGGDTTNNTNDIRYSDFFAPPPRKLSASDRRRALPKTQPPSSTPTGATEQDIQRTISAVKRDIFEDDLTPDEDAASDAEDGRSSHQKRQAKIVDEIRRLEVAAVTKRDWTLSGEARAADRPINSLLEEDLEFERAGKPVPVITQEVSEDIEALIKRRILAKDFDEVIRRRPSNLATGGGKDMRRGRFELEDSKPQQSLAELYEADHLKTVDPKGYIDKRDEKLKREHAKIEALWKDVSAKLDALSSWHYRPKPPSANINVVTDVPAINMEDARPSAGGDVGGASRLAPQEVYKAGEARDKASEVTSRSGLPVGREEMTRDEKVRRRRREKERIRNAGGLAPVNGGEKKQMSKVVKERNDVVDGLKKGGVRVIGKKGDIQDVKGNAVKGQVIGRGAGGYKL